ncbi:hypothetical protein L210DRAFT_3651840 [Boletus edulis BED1]|uniref:SMP domain-containing protein n=1 Tax=Boletus edulis BED1 TaxID=1328754 RepID=A0AAD4G9I9_BOLED|nr:hypothetical protein L210DRAFT_3652106 [Boletus edulis BED1]KAF8430525.1 hypothetical protein L210DRAFT_3651840 [Boletus edulis BED1]
MPKNKPMDKEAAARIQSNADRTGNNQDFKARAQSTADRREHANTSGGNGGTEQSGKK